MQTGHRGRRAGRVQSGIAGALAGARLARRISTRQAYLLGLTLSLAAMTLLLISASVRTDQAAAASSSPGVGEVTRPRPG